KKGKEVLNHTTSMFMNLTLFVLSGMDHKLLRPDFVITGFTFPIDQCFMTHLELFTQNISNAFIRNILVKTDDQIGLSK
ncbi:hypothetical protein H4219_006118, partial [Mycoemilia scoparia]